MTNLTRIDILIQTGSHSDAGTDGRIYLGLGGREFRCDSSADDFERGASRTYIFGDGANVSKRESNDPRNPQLIAEDLIGYPMYLRFEQGSASHWLLQRAMLHLNGSSFQNFETRLGSAGLWLGFDSGAYCHLHRHDDGVINASTGGGAGTAGVDPG